MIEANKNRIVNMLEDIAAFTEPLEEGVQRISYSREYKDAQQYLCQKMKELGMTVFVDQTGNLFGTMPGTEYNSKIMSGSHLDTVRVAGKYDGAAGIVAAMEVAALLKENDIMLRHPYQVICTIAEEGTRFNQTLMGSQFLCGVHGEKQYEDFKGFDDRTLKETIEAYGLEDIASVREYHAEDVACMLELHGEQGPVLEKTEKKIGH